MLRYFPFAQLAKGHEKKNKGNSEKPFVYWGLAHALRARVSEDLKCLYARCDVCVCVCVKTFSEICKYKALKDARELEFFCIDALLVIFVCLIISRLLFLIGLSLVQTPIPLT
ncbi:hypothetical protein AS203_08815 [Hoylesella enoeca]|uniref:Uncharacterized protein n=1 Tax=Hoylesella enoeca TaxID=76123 RepID=A0A0S2KLK9_9BACT|nr:hypothetical protein AS203_08815 [Hoylesella enoeca]